MTVQRTIVCALLALTATPAGAQQLDPPRFHAAEVAARRAPSLECPEPRSSGAPRRASGGKVFLQFLAGTAGAIAVGVAGYELAANPAHDRVKGDEGYNREGNLGFGVGSFVGATIVTYVAGRLDGSHGSLASTALGAALPALPIVATYDEPYGFAAATIIFVPLEGLGATVGYQSTRRER